jgi:tripartite-type tricarboxylate transporter receptor subunit TctC
MPITLRRRHLLALVATVLAIAQAQAQAFPSKPIKLIVGFAPGGAEDIFARAVGQQFGATLSIKPH